MQQLEEARFKKVDQQKQNQKEKLESQTYKTYQKIEDIPKDWSLKTGVDISIANPNKSCDQLHKKLTEICKFYVFNSSGCHNFSNQNQSK